MGEGEKGGKDGMGEYAHWMASTCMKICIKMSMKKLMWTLHLKYWKFPPQNWEWGKDAQYHFHPNVCAPK